MNSSKEYYYQKYFKYKNKYLGLQKNILIGGSSGGSAAGGGFAPAYENDILYDAILIRDKKLIKSILANNPNLIHQPFSNGMYPIHLAMCIRWEPFCDYLIEHGATLLHLVPSTQDDPEYIRQIQKRLSDPNEDNTGFVNYYNSFDDLMEARMGKSCLECLLLNKNQFMPVIGTHTQPREIPELNKPKEDKYVVWENVFFNLEYSDLFIKYLPKYIDELKLLEQKVIEEIRLYASAYDIDSNEIYINNTVYIHGWARNRIAYYDSESDTLFFDKTLLNLDVGTPCKQIFDFLLLKVEAPGIPLKQELNKLKEEINNKIKILNVSCYKLSLLVGNNRSIQIEALIN